MVVPLSAGSPSSCALFQISRGQQLAVMTRPHASFTVCTVAGLAQVQKNGAAGDYTYSKSLQAAKRWVRTQIIVDPSY